MTFATANNSTAARSVGRVAACSSGCVSQAWRGPSESAEAFCGNAGMASPGEAWTGKATQAYRGNAGLGLACRDKVRLALATQAWHGHAGRGADRIRNAGRATLGAAVRGGAWHGNATQAGRDLAARGSAARGSATQATQGVARQGEAWTGNAGTARLGKDRRRKVTQRRHGWAGRSTTGTGVATQAGLGRVWLVEAERDRAWTGSAGKARSGRARSGGAEHYTTQTGERVRGINCAHFSVRQQQQIKGDNT